MIIHKEAAAGRWLKFSLAEQMANVGTDLERTLRWKQKGKTDFFQDAFARTKELLSLTIADAKNELVRTELELLLKMLIQHFFTETENCCTNEVWQNYFLSIGWAAALQSGK